MKRLQLLGVLAAGMALADATPSRAANTPPAPGVVSDIVQACSTVIRRDVGRDLKIHSVGFIPSKPMSRRELNQELKQIIVTGISFQIVRVARDDLPTLRESLGQYEARVSSPEKSASIKRNPFFECITHRRLAQLRSSKQGLGGRSDQPSNR